MGQERLHDLTAVFIEQTVNMKLNFEEVIDNFAEIKVGEDF